MKQKYSNIITILSALLVMAIWGSLYPAIKIGYTAFNINADSIPDILMFAGIRFLISGIAVSFALRNDKINDRSDIKYILLAGIFSIVLQYAFVYIGLSISDGSKASIIKQVGILVYVCFAFLFIRNEKFSIYKILGALIGFAGIAVMGTGGGGFEFSVGDIMIILSSLCMVTANIIIKVKLDGVSSFTITGISQFVGGAVLIVCAFLMGAKMPVFNLRAFGVFAYICIASNVAYILWYHIIKKNNLSNLFIIKFAEPLFACMFSAILLGEDIFKIQYLIAFILVSSGIMLGNKKGS